MSIDIIAMCHYTVVENKPHLNYIILDVLRCNYRELGKSDLLLNL